MRALEWMIFKVLYDSQQSHKKGEAQGIIWNRQKWHFPVYFENQEGNVSIQKYLCPSRTKPHKLSGRECSERHRGFGISQTWPSVPTLTPAFSQ